jgi:hypothetical protein
VRTLRRAREEMEYIFFVPAHADRARPLFHVSCVCSGRMSTLLGATPFSFDEPTTAEGKRVQAIQTRLMMPCALSLACLKGQGMPRALLS